MAAAAAGGERGGRGLLLALGALSREARRQRGRVGGLGGRWAPPSRQPPHDGQRGGRSQRETAVEREKGGKVGVRTPGGSRPCPQGPRDRKICAHSGARALAGLGRGRGPGLVCGSRPTPGSGGSSPRPQGLGRRFRVSLLRDPAAPRPVKAAALGDRGRGRGGGNFWRTRAAHSLPAPPEEGAGPLAGLLER